MNPAFVLCLVYLTSHDQWYVLQRFIDRHLNYKTYLTQQVTDLCISNKCKKTK